MSSETEAWMLVIDGQGGRIAEQLVNLSQLEAANSKIENACHYSQYEVSSLQTIKAIHNTKQPPPH